MVIDSQTKKVVIAGFDAVVQSPLKKRCLSTQNNPS